MEDMKLIISFIKDLSCLIYDKEIFFYDFDNNEWYSRIHCKTITFKEVLECLKEEVTTIL